MKVLVTGGAGYVGSVTTRVFLEAGHEVVVLDNLSHGNRHVVPAGVRFIEGDVGRLAQYVSSDDAIDVVVHLAASISAAESMQKPELYWQNNVHATCALLTDMRALGIKKLIFASTAAVYGNPARVPIVETDPKDPTNTYGMTKLAADMAISSEVSAYNLAAASARFFNVAGAYKDVGEQHPQETHLIPLALQAAAGERESMKLFGVDYETEDGTCIRDYIHVTDLAKAMLLATTKLTPGKHTIYNLGNGNGFSNREVLESVQRVTGSQFKIIEEPRRPGDPAVLVASNQRAYDELGWQPERPHLDDIVRDAWEFYQNRA